MNAAQKIDINKLRFQDNLKVAPSIEVKHNSEENPFLFKFKHFFLGLLKEEFPQVVLTNKTKKTPESAPFYQVVIDKQHLIIKDLVGESLKRKLVYTWGLNHILLNGQEEPLETLKPFLRRLEKDLNERTLEVFYA